MVDQRVVEWIKLKPKLHKHDRTGCTPGKGHHADIIQTIQCFIDDKSVNSGKTHDDDLVSDELPAADNGDE